MRRARQSRMKIAEGMTCAPVGNAAACVSVRPVHLRRHASQVCAHSSPRAHAARTTATGETEFFERWTEFLMLKLLPNVRKHLKPRSRLSRRDRAGGLDLTSAEPWSAALGKALPDRLEAR